MGQVGGEGGDRKPSTKAGVPCCPRGPVMAKDAFLKVPLALP